MSSIKWTLMVKRILLVTAAIFVALPATAATLQLIPSVAEVNPGETFTVDLYMDAADAPGLHPGAFQGFVTINFVNQLVRFDGFDYTGATEFGGGPIVDTGQITLGFDDAQDVGVIGSFTFKARNATAPGEILNFSLIDAVPVLGSFVNTVPTIQPFTPDISGAGVSVVPLPAAAWLMLSGLGLLGGMAARRKSAR